VSAHLRALTAHRTALQAEIALQRDDARQACAEIEQGLARVDRVVATVRRATPLLAVIGAIGLLAFGPGRALNFARRGLTLGLYASQLRRLLG
jgi:hypothetical protein